jgi:two-component system, cell cycle sensor histidine kinase and response regulator CckA
MIKEKERSKYLTNTLRTIRDINRLIHYEKDSKTLLNGICQLITSSRGFQGGWIVLLDKEKPAEPFYHTGYGHSFQPMADYLKAGHIPPCAQEAMARSKSHTIVNFNSCDDCPFDLDKKCGNMTCALFDETAPLGWISITTNGKLIDDDEEVLLFTDLAEDIAHALRTLQVEKELKESETRFEMLFQRAPLGYQSLDIDGRFIEVNQAWLDTLGYSREEILGRWFGDFLAPEYVDAFRERFPLFKERGVIHSEFYMLHKSGERRYIIFEGRIGHKKNGDFQQTHCILADHTQKKKVEIALKESEDRLRCIFENINAGVFLYEACPDEEDFVLVDINQGGCQLVGENKEDLKGKKISQILRGSKEMGLLQSMLTASQTGIPQSLPMTSYKDEKLSLILESHISPLPSGKIVVLHEDKTDFFQMEERLRQSEKMEAIGKLAGGVAHDFNNILCGILGFTELTRCSPVLEEEERTYLDKILQAGDRAQKLIDQILSFSRQRSVEKIPVDLVKQVEEAITFLKATLPATIAVDIHLEKETMLILADSVKIYEIIINLCLNSASSMKNKGTITVFCHRETLLNQIAAVSETIEPGDYAVLTIKDEGCGMTEQTLNRIFEPFFTTKGVGEGTGMGLSVVFGIVHDHKGRIIVTSEPDRGTEFKIYFPLHKREK